MAQVLRKANGFNEFPEGYKFPELPASGTVVKFKLLKPPVNELVDEKWVKRYPVSYVLPVSSDVYDPSTKRNIKIAIVTETDKEGNMTRAHKIRFNAEQSQGELYVTMGSPMSDAIYTYLMLASHRQRGDNENQTTAVLGIEPLYKLVDEVFDAKIRSELRAAKTAAIKHASELEDTELQNICMVLGLNEKEEIAILRDSIEYYAETFPKDYLSRVNDEDNAYRLMFRKALAARVFMVKGKEVIWGETNATAFAMRSDAPENAADEFVYFVKTNEMSKNILAILRKKVDETEAKKPMGRPKKDA